MLGIREYFWRLIPANPILLRVVESGGKRRRDAIIRCAYLGILIALVLFFLAGSGGSTGGRSLDKLAQASVEIFQKMSYLQLALVALLAPIFTAGAITQEKDSQTYDILLTTPLTNGQIVLGSLLSRLFFVLALLISGIPVFAITQIFGGVAIRSIVFSFLIAAATAFVTGALAMAIAVFKVGTRRTIFSFYLFVVIYLVGVFLLDRSGYFNPTLGHETDANGALVLDARGKPKPILAKTTWLTGIHPFLALRAVFNDQEYLPPDRLDLPIQHRGWLVGWYLTSPHTFYISFMFLLSFGLIAPSIVLLRRLAQTTSSLRSWLLQKLRLSRGDQTRKPRMVWNNPIAWREAKTKASAARASILRYAFIAAGVVGAFVLMVLYASREPVDLYVNAGSYEPDSRSLTYIDGDRAVTMKLAPFATVRFNGQPASPEVITGRLRVDRKSLTTQGTTLLTIDLEDVPRRLSGDNARKLLLGAVIVEFAVILLIVTNAAASTVTREKEDGSLDLLLSTPITSRYYIWGKLRGLVSFVLPLVAVPVVSVLFFVIYDALRAVGQRASELAWIVFPEAVLILPGTLVIVAAFAAILGMNMSLRCRTTVRAVMSSVGIVVGACAALGWCGWGVLNRITSASVVNLVFASFSPFTVVMVLVDPQSYGGGVFDDPTDPDVALGRAVLFIGAWAATGAYALLVWSMYKAMVKNFDMTIRRQSR